MVGDLVSRLAAQLARAGWAEERQVLLAVVRGGEVTRWPSPGGHGPPAADMWAFEPNRYRAVHAQVEALRREELVQLLDAPAPGARRPWAATPLGRAVSDQLAALPVAPAPLPAAGGRAAGEVRGV